MSDSSNPHGLQPTRLLCPWDSPGKNTGVDCHFLLQGIFLTQGSSPGLLRRRQILYQLSYERNRTREWIHACVAKFLHCSPEVITTWATTQHKIKSSKEKPNKQTKLDISVENFIHNKTEEEWDILKSLTRQYC